MEAVAVTGATEIVLGYFQERCFEDGTNVHAIIPAQPAYPFGSLEGFWLNPGHVPFVFDDKLGRILVAVNSPCRGSAGCPYSPTFEQYWIAAIEGFATTFEVLQTFEPAPPRIGFRVPYMPEGLPAASSFDTYVGPLTSPIDFTAAHPLQCGYPASPPNVGDYLTITAPLPDPPAGEGVWIVTATNYTGQRRYGRQRIEGALSGRDPGLLPACQTTRVQGY